MSISSKDQSTRTIMPEEFPGKIISDARHRKGLHGTPNLVTSPDEHPGPPIESPNHTVGGFYARDAAPDELPSVEGDVSFRFGSEVDMSSETREYIFPPRILHHKSSFSDNFTRCRTGSTFPTSPQKNLKFRSYSISITDPVYRSAYESLPQSPAASFLAQFAPSDDWKNRPKFEDGNVLDKYKIGRVIGRGSFSECREGAYARCSSPNNDKVAMKIVRSDEEHGQNLADFDRELAIWKRLRHKNILPLLDFLRFENALIAISPIAEHGTLLDYLTKNGPFNEDEARSLFRQICEAVAHMHNDHGIVHRDIKLDNILLDGRLCPYVCDFGLSECINARGRSHEINDSLEIFEFADEAESSTTSTSKTRTDDEIYCKGSLWYLSPEELEPELLRDAQKQGLALEAESRKKGDIWALGIVLYAMVTGKLPFADDFLPRLQVSVITGNYPPLPDDVSICLKDMQSRLLTVDVLKRPSIGEVLEHQWLRKN